MGRKPKYTKEQKFRASEQYLNSALSPSQTANASNRSKKGCDLVLKWSSQYKKLGPAVFDINLHNKSCTADFKTMMVKDHLRNGFSTARLAVKHNIPSGSAVCSKDYKLRAPTEEKKGQEKILQDR